MTVPRIRILVSLILIAAVAAFGATAYGGGGGDGGGAADSLEEFLQRASDIQEPVPMVDLPGEPTEGSGPLGGPSVTIGDRIATEDWVPPAAESLTWHGFPDTTMPQMGSLWGDEPGLPEEFAQMCSGTVVTRGLVVTAAHCLYDDTNAEWKWSQIRFIPGQTWIDPQSVSPLDIQAPEGVWSGRAWWIPEGYRDGSVDLDWALIEIEPQDGRYVGDVVGAFPIQTGIEFLDGARIWSAGYPAMGWWATPEGRLGRGQYSCDTTWDGAWLPRANGAELWIRCPMNGGSSGGPWLVELNSGRWVIGGVNNWCNDEFETDDEPGTYCTPVSTDLRSLVFDERFLDFWNGVLPLLTS